MSFSYDETLPTDLDKIRLRIQDTAESPNGIKPLGANFADEEITGLLAIEGSINRTVAAIYETLAVSWANYADTKIGPRDEKLSQVSPRYAAMAKQWRDNYGYGSSRVTVTTSFVTRQDAYSNDIDAGETESL